MATELRTPPLDEAALATMTAAFRGEVIRREAPGYEDARRVFNAAVDRRPALIARPVDVGDIQTALQFGIDHRLEIAVRGGGHHGAGFGTVDDGLVIDLGRLRGIRVDPDARTVRVEPGCTLADLDHATHAFGLAVPTGIFGTTGIAGPGTWRWSRPPDSQARADHRQFARGRRPARAVSLSRRARRRTRSSSGRFAEAAATSASSRRSCFGHTRSRRSLEARRCTGSTRRRTSSVGTATSCPRRLRT